MRRLGLFTAAVIFVCCASSVFSQAGRGTQAGGNAPGGNAPGGGRPGAQASETQDGRQSQVATAEVTEKYQSISAGGRLKPKISVDHQATAAGIVSAVYVRQGQQAAEGQELFSIERDSRRAVSNLRW